MFKTHVSFHQFWPPTSSFYLYESDLRFPYAPTGPVTGERVTVVGAGLIGLLVVSILSRLHLTTLRAVDPIPSRRKLAELVGASEVIDPSNLANLEEDARADTSIEVSGVAAGLQTALDYTGYGGRVIIGSWYANHQKPAPIKLGLAFHRSHLRILVSQVP